jgi:hypothetical protein
MGENDGVLQQREHCVKKRGTEMKVSRKAKKGTTVGEMN